jgi:hypothetical protein
MKSSLRLPSVAQGGPFDKLRAGRAALRLTAFAQGIRLAPGPRWPAMSERSESNGGAGS